MAGSMRLRRKRPEDNNMALNTYWFPWTIDSVRNMLESLSEKWQQVILYGEIYGSGIQKGYGYDRTPGKLGFRVFDLMLEGDYQCYAVMKGLCLEFGVEMVPALYEGPFSIEAIRKVAGGMTTVGDSNIREGVVIKPVSERRHPQVGRLAMKYLSDDYLLSKHPDSTDV